MANFSSLSRHSEWATAVDILYQRSANSAQQNGYCFLHDGETQAVNLSYAELDQQARTIAAALQQFKAEGERALLLFPPGLDYIAAFFGCLYAGVVAVPVYPPRRNQTLTRLEAIAADAQARFVLTAEVLLSEIKRHDLSQFGTVEHWIATDAIAPNFAADWRFPSIPSDSLALLQYTSGSTGQPKGVKISHANLLHNSAIIHRAFEHRPDRKGVIWLPPYHDMGLIGGILQPLYGGFPVVLMSPVAFLQKPIRWLQAITDCKGTTSGAPNFAYERCIEKITAAQKADLDLSSWDVAFTGAEPIRADTLARFAEAFAVCGFRPEAFYPCYGLAEATLFVAGAEKLQPPKLLTVSKTALQQNRVVVSQVAQLSNQQRDRQQDQQVVSSGRTAIATIIVDPETRRRCAPDQIGEIWLAGESMAQGYWNQPELTQQTFQAQIEGSEKRYLRTGDLGFLYQDELFVTGRLKDIIIIRGQNYYPQDIEQTLAQSHPALANTAGAAFSIEKNYAERLILVQEVARKYWRSIDANAIIEAIRFALSNNHQLQADAIILVKPGGIPKTSSGKVQRHACRDKFCNETLDVIGQWRLDDRENRSTSIPSVKHPPVKHIAQTIQLPPSRSDMAAQKTNSIDQANHLIEWLRDYATHHINSRLMDERRSIAPHIVLDFGNQGLLGMQVSSEYSGLGLGHCSTMRVLEQLGAIDPTLALFVGLNNVLGIRPIARYATPALRAELLPLLATGRELAAFALTESVAGSNPQSISSQAISYSNGWLLTGRKIWSGSAAWAGVINVFVQHQHEGISGFAVRRGTPGLRQGTEALTMGMRGMVQNTVHLEQVPVYQRELLGEIGAGMSVAQDAMMYGRLAIAAASLGGMKRCAQLMLRYSQRRTISTGRLLDNPITLARLSNLTAAITAIESLVSQIAQQLDAGQPVPLEAYTACKIAAPEFYWQAADWLVQTLGGRGYLETNLAPQILRDARVLRIFEGPTETLNLFLGSRVIHQPQTLEIWLSQTLNAPEIAQSLFAAVAQIRESSSTDQVTAQRWTAFQIGELATLAILWATLKANPSSTQLQQAINWIQQQFEQKIEKILSGTISPLHVEEFEDSIVNYIKTIGDIEQQLAGEDDRLDELLRKSINPPTPSVTPTVQADHSIHPTSSLSADSATPSPTAIQTWLVNWISQKLHLPAHTIDRHKSFADYGIDSVIAVELAQDLETWLQLTQPLEATVAWNFPTIAALAAYLTSLTPPSPPPPTPLSDTELAQLLTAEIAAARRSRQ